MADSNSTQDQDKNNQLLEALNKHLVALNNSIKHLDPSHPKQQAVKRGSDGMLRDFFAKHAAKEAKKHEKRSDQSASQRLKEDLGTHKESHRRLKNHTDRLFDSTKKFADSADGMFHTIQTTLGAFVGGKIVGDLLGSGRDMIKTYQRMSDVGQSFGGSMISMGAQAAAAGVPLSEFARQIERNSNVAAALASSNMSSRTSLGELSKAVRENIKQSGFFGMAIDEISDLTGDYAENMRLQGRSADINKDKTSRFVGSLANEITAFAAITGKSRKEIERDSHSAMQDAGMLTSGMSTDQNNSVTSLTTAVASMPGTLGPQLAKMIAQSAGNEGGVWMSELGQQLSKAGLGDMLPMIQQVIDKTQDGTYKSSDAAGLMKNMMGMFNSGPIKEFLNKIQVNNSDAKSLIEMFSHGNGFDFSKIGQVSEDVKRQNSITAFFNTLDDNLNGLNAAFHGGMFDALSKGLAFDNNATNETFKNLQGAFKALGASVGGLITTVFTKDNIALMSRGVELVVKVGAGLLTSVFGYFTRLLATADQNVPKIEQAITDFVVNVKRDAIESWKFFQNYIVPAGRGIKDMIDVLMFPFHLLSTVVSTVNGLFKPLNTYLGSFLPHIKSLDDGINWVSKKFGLFGDVLIGLAAVAATVTAGIAVLFGPAFIKKKFMSAGAMMFAKATITAAEVIVNGSASSGIGGGGSKKEKAARAGETAGTKKRRGIRFRRSKEAAEGVAETAEHLAHKGRIARMWSSMAGRKGVAGAMAGAAGVAAAGSALPIKSLMGRLGKTALGMAKFIPFVGAIPTAISAAMRIKDGDYKGAAVDGLSAVLQGTGVGGPIADLLQAGMLARDVVGAIRPGQTPGDATGATSSPAAPGVAGPGHAARSNAGSLAKGLAVPAAVAAATFAATRMGQRDDDRVVGLQGRYDSLTDSLALDRQQDASVMGGDAYVLGLRKIEEAVKEQTQIMMLMSKQGFDLQRKGNQKQQEAINAATNH